MDEPGIPMDIQDGGKSPLPELADMIGRFAGVKVAIDHMAHAPIKDGPPFRKAEEVLAFALPQRLDQVLHQSVCRMPRSRRSAQ